MTDNISSNIKLFADDSSLFLRVKDVNVAHRTLTEDLEKITAWANQWKMKFNPDMTKQAIEVIFSSKYKKPSHPDLTFNEIPVARNNATKHIGMILDEKLNFRKHILEAIEKAKKGLSLMRFLAKYVNRKILDLTYKMHVRTHLEYGDVIFHNCSQDLMDLIESVQYQAGLIVTGCWRGTSRVRLYNELGWESMAERRDFRRLTLYHKIKTDQTPDYLKPYILDNAPSGNAMFKRSFFPYCFV